MSPTEITVHIRMKYFELNAEIITPTERPAHSTELKLSTFLHGETVPPPPPKTTLRLLEGLNRTQESCLLQFIATEGYRFKSAKGKGTEDGIRRGKKIHHEGQSPDTRAARVSPLEPEPSSLQEKTKQRDTND